MTGPMSRQSTSGKWLLTPLSWTDFPSRRVKTGSRKGCPARPLFYAPIDAFAAASTARSAKSAATRALALKQPHFWPLRLAWNLQQMVEVALNRARPGPPGAYRRTPFASLSASSCSNTPARRALRHRMYGVFLSGDDNGQVGQEGPQGSPSCGFPH
jgi:hypothetical protein